MSLSYFAETVGGVEQLWVSDGTLAGTHMVRTFAGSPIFNLTMIGAKIYFAVDDGVHGEELWVSDGSAAGTMQVADIFPGAVGSGPAALTNVNGELFFGASDGMHGFELWQSDGTAAGTAMVEDIWPGAAGGLAGLSFADVNGTLFFAAKDGINGAELWKSDGTAAGTVMVKDIQPGPTGSFPQVLTNVNGTLFFAADDGTHGAELWKSDGTAAGTVLVKDINPGSGAGVGGLPFIPVNVNGTLFFAADDGIHGVELWKSDGTTAGTVMVADINPAGPSDPDELTNVNGTLFFYAADPAHGFELWKSDGTAAGTVLVKDIAPGGGSSATSIQSTVNVNGTLFFAASDGPDGNELWKSDGTAAGTMMVKDINPAIFGVPGVFSSNPVHLINVNGVLEFYANDGTTEALFRSDGTAAGTIEIATNVDINTPIGFTPQPAVSDFNGDRISDILWRNSSGELADWTMNGGAITAGNFLTSGGSPIAPAASWSIAGISDFTGDGNADILWRNSDGTLATWIMNGNAITSSGTPNIGGAAVTPGASWSVAGTGDFDGDTRSDILWRNTDGTLTTWTMNGSTILSGNPLTSGGVAVKPDASWSVAGIGDFNGDNRKDMLWRNSSGETAIWQMNGSTISSGGDTTSGGVAVKPGASWSVAGVGDFNQDGNADILWRNSSGALSVWLMNGSTIISSAAIMSGGATVTPDATWHIVEVGDFNGDSASDILWRNDSGAMSEWLMSGTTIIQSVTPSSGGSAASPDATWTTQAKPTIG